jgi:hypothetical protein
MSTPKVEHLTNPEIMEIIDLRVHKELHRDVLKRKLCDGATFEVIAEEFDISPCGAKKIVYSYKHLFDR